MKKKKIVIALGHEALGTTLPEQKEATKRTAKAVADFIRDDYQVVITHSNGPQVGMIHTAMNEFCRLYPEYTATPMSVCSAMSQGYIGYDLQNAIRAELLNKGIYKPVSTILTQVVVDPYDEAFYKPSKVIGRVLTEEEAEAEEKKGNHVVKTEGGYRRIVAAPKPMDIVEIDAIKALSDADQIVVACGGGGIPVLMQDNNLKGASAVIEKDLAAGKLAELLDADMLVILTSVDNVCLNYGQPDEKPLSTMTVAEAKKYMEDKEQNKEVEYDPDMEALCLALKGEIPCKIHCTQYDMLTAIEIAKKYNVHFSLEHAWGATDYLDEIVESGCDVCYGPIATYRSPGERRKIDVEAVKMLDDRGVNVAMITDSPILSEESLYHHVGEAVREGLAQERAVRTVTINAAKVLGVEDRLGSLEEGKDADIIVMKGKLGLDTDAMVYYTMIEGKIVYQK